MIILTVVVVAVSCCVCYKIGYKQGMADLLTKFTQGPL
jgi:hypothetical protein